MVKILIAEEVQILRDCLKLAIESGDEFEVVACASNGLEAIEMTKIFEPDLVLLELNMPIISGYNVIKDIKKINSKIKILVLTLEENEESMNLALQKGADGYFLKNIRFDDLYMILKSTFGDSSFYFNNKEFMKEGEYNTEIKNVGELKIIFTPREKQVLELVVKGMTNEEIAGRLKISIGRARNIVTELMNKCMAKNRTQLAVMSINASLVKDI